MDVQDSFAASKLYLENMVGPGESLDYPPNISSFRHYPERHIVDMAEDAVEAMLLSHMRHCQGLFEYYMPIAGDTRDPAYRIQFLNFAMRISEHMIKLSDAFRRGRRNGRQEVIVKHQESDGGPVRRPRARRSDPRENAPKVSSAKRSVPA